METLNKIFAKLNKVRGIIPALALALAIQSASSTCFFCLYQPNVPEDLR